MFYFRTSELNKNMPGCKMNLKRKGNYRSLRGNKRSKQLWLPSLILSSRTKNNKSGLKTRRCYDTLRINFTKKNNKNRRNSSDRNNKKDKWGSTWPSKSRIKNSKNWMRKRSMKNRQKFGNKIRPTFSITKRTRQSI